MNPQNPSASQAQQQVIDRLQTANNVLVTVSSNPSVDQLAACIGFTLFLNKIGKRGTAVFSGKVPSTIEFLEPEKTIEKNTDSLRDFIIALDKTKADKLRYKVEDKYVRIFITPYKTTIGEKDLEFSQGDFNIDVVLALGVSKREDLDGAITAHGRILHDAAVISVSNKELSSLGAINWNEPMASSLCEMLVSLGDVLQPRSLDAQMATAYLTGIVSETGRFKNQQTHAHTMTISAELISAGANPQLVASKLEPEIKIQRTNEVSLPKVQKPEDTGGELTIVHTKPKTEQTEAEIDPDEISIDDKGTLEYAAEQQRQQRLKAEAAASPKVPIGNTNNFVNGRLMEPSSGVDSDNKPVKDTDDQAAIDNKSVFSYGTAPNMTPSMEALTNQTPQPPLPPMPTTASVASGPPPLNEARNIVDKAINSAEPTGPLPPIEALNAQPVDLGNNSYINQAPHKVIEPPTHDPASPQATQPPKPSSALPTMPPPPPMPPPMMPPPMPPAA